MSFMYKFRLTCCLILLALIASGCKDDGNNPVVNQSNISLISTYSTNASTNGVYVTTINFKDYAFLADGTNGMQIVDVTAPNNPDSVSSFNTGGSANDVFVATINGDIYAFVSDFNTGFVIIDVSDVTNPQQVGLVAGPYANTSFIDAPNNKAYFSRGAVYIYDISNLPGTITYLSVTPSVCEGIYVTGGKMYTAENSNGFSIYDVTNPTAPQFISRTNTLGLSSSVTVIQNNLYLADSYNGTLIFNVTNPSAPSLLSRIAPSPSGQVLGVAVNNNTLYTADNNYGVESINISNPSSPSQNGNIQLNSSASNIFYFGGYLYLAAAEGGLAILQPAN